MKQKFSLLLALFALSLTMTPALTSCNTEPDYIQRIRNQEEAQKKLDEEAIKAYLTRHNITNFTRLESGIYLVSITDGPTSNPLITPGKQVTVNYVGKFIDEKNEDQVFDASSNNRTQCGCFGFTNGSAGVITGWNTASLNMRLGDRKLIFIPSYLAYGATNYGTIVANTPLLFDMEILNVE
ncbi:FKBP-type peptidyl-prolyl cis-trans isomerase [Hymenobacter tenuis]